MNFDKFGNLFPYGVIICDGSSWDVLLKGPFPKSERRAYLFKRFLQYNQGLLSVVNPFTYWIDGSFVTNKTEPEDIDLALLIENGAIDKEIDYLLPFLTVGGSLDEYHIDAHVIPIYPENDSRYENTLLRLNYFREWFSQDRLNNPKGFLEIFSTKMDKR